MTARPPSRLVTVALRHPALAFALLGAMAVGSVALVKTRMMRGTAFESLIDRTHPSQEVLDAVNAKFGNDRFVSVLYVTDDVFSARALGAIRRLTEELRGLELAHDGTNVSVAQDVKSLTSVDDAFGSEDSFRSRLLVPEPIPQAPDELQALRRRALANPLIDDHYLSKDPGVGVLRIHLSDAVTEPEMAQVGPMLHELLARTTSASGIVFHMCGKPIIEERLPIVVRKDMVRATLMLLLLAFVAVWFALGRITPAVVVVVLIVPIAAACMFASIPLTGGTLQTLTNMLIPITIVLAATTAIHFFCEIGRLRQFHVAEANLGAMTLSIVATPLVMTLVTEVVGFLGFAGSNVPAINQLGLAGALGTVFLGLTVFLVLSIVLALVPDHRLIAPNAFAIGPTIDRFIAAVSSRIVARPRTILAAGLVVLAVAGIGTTRIVVGARPLEFFWPDSPIRVAQALMDTNFGGSNPFVISIKTNEVGRFESPVELQKLDDLDAFLRAQVGVTRTVQAAQWVKVMNRAFFNEDDKQYKIPETAPQVAQLLAHNSADDLYDYLDRDHRWTRLIAITPVQDTAETAKIYATVEAYLAEHFPASQGYDAAVTGEFYIVTLSANGVARNVQSALGTSVLLLLLVFGIAFRSWQTLLAAVVPNVLPLLIVLGGLGWTGTHVGVNVSIVCSITLGMCVDDTFHFLLEFRAQLLATGNHAAAVVATCHRKGSSMILTSSMFAAGFAMLTTAENIGARQIGALTSISMLVAFVSTFILLPCTLLVTKTRLGLSSDVSPAP